ILIFCFFFFSSRRRHTRCYRDWSSDVCSSDLAWTSVASARLLSLLKAECEMPPFFVTTDELAAAERHSPPRLDRFIEGLQEIGYRATRTHFHPRGVKTDAPSQDIVRMFRELSPTGSTDDSRPAS